MLKSIIPFIIICASILNLSMKWGDEKTWMLFLCISMAYLIPSPEVQNSIKRLLIQKEFITKGPETP